MAALVAVAAAIVGISTKEQRSLGPKFVALDRIARLTDPVYLTQPPGPGSQLYVVQRQGVVRIISSDHLLGRPFLDIHSLVGSQAPANAGMSSIAFAPDYRRSGLFYVSYTNAKDTLRIVEYRRSAADPLVADPDSARLVLSIPEPTPMHHSGFIVFGHDGDLYVATGDGGPRGDPANRAQDRNTLLGKILRIDPRRGTPYSIPAGNPFVGRPGRPEIWAYGFQNPRRLAFDDPTKTIGIGDAGDEHYEEVDYLPIAKARGANFGWPAFEGFRTFRGGLTRRETALPALAYPIDPGCRVTGGYLLRDPRLARIRGREIFGDYFFGDYCTGRVYAFRPRKGRKPGKLRSFRFRLPHLVSFGEDNQGRIYVITQRGRPRHGKPTLGSIYRLVPRRKPL